jgi:hypothetical protein
VLRIRWNTMLPLAAFIGLNPSTADEFEDDHTIRRERGFADSWGCGGIVKLNAFAYRATLPADMLRQDDPNGPGNTIAFMRQELSQCDGPKVACWGTHGTFGGRGELLKAALPGLQCFGLNSDGTPKHPLYLAATTILIPYSDT